MNGSSSSLDPVHMTENDDADDGPGWRDSLLGSTTRRSGSFSLLCTSPVERASMSKKGQDLFLQIYRDDDAGGDDDWDSVSRGSSPSVHIDKKRASSDLDTPRGAFGAGAGGGGMEAMAMRVGQTWSMGMSLGSDGGGEDKDEDNDEQYDEDYSDVLEILDDVSLPED